MRPLDRDQAREVISTLGASANSRRCAVCLLWSIANGGHEQEIGRLIEQELPGVPYTLVAPACPDRTRISPRFDDSDRRLA